MAQPGERPLDDPPSPVPPQLAPILMGCALVGSSRGDDRLDAPTGQPGAQGIAVIAPIRHQALGALAGSTRRAGAADGDRVEGLLEEGDFRRGCRVQVCSHRSTRAIDQNHPLCTLAACRLANLRPPFFAGAKLPSAKPSSHRICCWSLSWATKARHSFWSIPVSSQCLSRRQQVLGLPYRRGSSLHGDPVHRIQRIPSQQRRSSALGRPPHGRACGRGKWTRMASHGSLLSFRHAMSHPQFFVVIHGVMIP
jgi:hypothetical protein